MLFNLKCLALLSSTVLALPSRAGKTFVKTSGTKFQLDGKDFFFAGSNAYVSRSWQALVPDDHANKFESTSPSTTYVSGWSNESA